MQAKGERAKQRLVSWNGLQLSIPKSWDARISGPCHLVFESEFHPLLQIRWEQPDHHSVRQLQQQAARCITELGPGLTKAILPEQLRELGNNFDQITCFCDEDGLIKKGVCLCLDPSLLVLFQILAAERSQIEEVNLHLSTLSKARRPENLWRIQDFSLKLPPDFALRDYTFASGLTRLSFFGSGLSLQTCTLGPADIRLRQQSLEEILLTLAGTRDLRTVVSEDGTVCEGFRSPTIALQIRFRLRREKPFVRAAVRQDVNNNRLLAVVLSATHPIDPAVLHAICQHYEIIPR